MPQAYATAPPPPSATSELTRMVSLPLPQELIEMIIDKLVDHELPSGPLAGISNYSTVSRQWVAGTQKHHFNSIYFESQADQDKWRTTINPDPSGVSRYVRMLSWFRVDTLEGFDRHIRAFTHVETAVLDVCGFIHSPSVVESFASMGSSLVELDIIGGSTTSGIIASLLAALPCLRQFRSLYLRIREDDDVIEYPLVIPFFEDPNSLDLQLDGYLRPSLSWVPPSARFRDLRINMPCILDESGCVNQWITSSAGTLESLSIVEHSEHHRGFIPPDLSGCTALLALELTLPLPQVVDIVLPSLSSFPPPKIVLHLEEIQFPWFDLQTWETMGKLLCQLAKRFKVTRPGKKMQVVVNSSDQCILRVWLLEQIESATVLDKLREDANVVIR